MSKKRILIVFGTRPEAIKMAPVIKVLSLDFEVKTCVTAQHRGMLDQVLDLFGITPDFDLNLMKSDQDLFSLSSDIMKSIKEVYESIEPDIVLVHGDTTTAMISALCAFYSRIPVGHVEAGLRTNNLKSPFPEELNRQIVSRIAEYHFSPTKTSKENLISEGIPEDKIYLTGNTVIDSIISVSEQADQKHFEKNLLNRIPFLSNKNQMKNYILVTGHRRENFGKGFEEICQAIKEIASKNPEFHIIYPVHLNPNVLRPVNTILTGLKNVHLVEPLPYLDFIKLMKGCYLILTDSGGIQEEAPTLGKPVIVMRDTSERPEAIEAGTAILSGPEAKSIIKSVQGLIDSKDLYQKMKIKHNPFGDGNASKQISDILKENIK